MRDALADVLLPADTADDVAFRVATVTDDSDPPIEVAIADATGLTAAYLASYTPVVDDVVLVLQTKTDLIILGLIQTGGA